MLACDLTCNNLSQANEALRKSCSSYQRLLKNYEK